MANYIRVAFLGMAIGFCGLSANRETHRTIGNIHLHIIEGDIFDIQADAIVDPANGDLDPRGGLSHHIATRIRLKGSNQWGADRNGEILNAGSAKVITAVPANQLSKVKFKYVIHAVGPDFTGLSKYAALIQHDMLRFAYQGALITATNHNYTSIAFPVISGEIFKGNESSESIAHIAVKAIIDWMNIIKNGKNKSSITDIYLVNPAKQGNSNGYYDYLVAALNNLNLGQNQSSTHYGKSDRDGYCDPSQIKQSNNNSQQSSQSNNQQNSYNKNFPQKQTHHYGLTHQIVHYLKDLKQRLNDLSATLLGR